jgi:hypothetical protein
MTFSHFSVRGRDGHITMAGQPIASMPTPTLQQMESHSMQMYKAEPEMRQHPGAQSIGECVCEYWVS